MECGKFFINGEVLPTKHTKLDYHECYAKIVLEEICTNEFNELEISDESDIQSIEKKSRKGKKRS